MSLPSLSRKPRAVDYRVVSSDEHACDVCEDADGEPIVMMGNATNARSETFICAACMKAALGLLRGLGLTP